MTVFSSHPSYLRWRLMAFLCVVAETVESSSGSSACPKSCACYVPTEVHCTFRYLSSIPGEIQPAVERMNLGYNSLTFLREKDFVGLHHLELLMLHSNAIHQIQDRTFSDLQSLQVLKMSYNRVKEINKGTFVGLKNLVRLHIDHNRIEFIDPEAFYGLTALQLVQLEGNLLQQLHPDTFVTMHYSQIFKASSVKTIHLADNALRSLPANIFSYCTQLENIYLHGNPWSCDCHMEWFVDWAKKNAEVLKCKRDKKHAREEQCPVCDFPAIVKGKNVAQLPYAALSCSKPFIVPHLKKNNITLDEDDYSPVTPGDFLAPIGSLVMNITDQFHNDASIICTVQRPSGIKNINVTQDDETITLSATVATSLVCNIDYEQIQQLWRILATYSDYPMRLQRGHLLTKTPEMIYKYTQRSPDGSDEEIFTNIEAEIKASPGWLLQDEITLQLDRTTTTFTTLSIKYLSTVLVREERKERKDRYSWVMIKKDNSTKTEHAVLTGGIVNLNCEIYGNPKPSVEWILPDGSKVRAPYNSDDRRIIITDSGKLTLRAADISDNGLYHCIATSYLDADVVTFRISVLPVDVEDMDVNGVHLSHTLGDHFALECTCTGNPKPLIQWILPDHTVLQGSNGNKQVFENGTLKIHKLTERDRGFYRCITANYMGVDLLVSQVTVSRHEPQKNTGSIREGSGGEVIIDSEEVESVYKIPLSGPTHSQESRTITSDRPYPGHKVTMIKGPKKSSRRVWGTRRDFDKTSRKVVSQKWSQLINKPKKNKHVINEQETDLTEKKQEKPIDDIGSGFSEDELILIPTATSADKTVSKLHFQTDATPLSFPPDLVTTGSFEPEVSSVAPFKVAFPHTDVSTLRNVYSKKENVSGPPPVHHTLKMEMTDITNEMQVMFSGDGEQTATEPMSLIMTQHSNLTTVKDGLDSKVKPVVHTSTDSDGHSTFTAITTTERDAATITFHTTQKIKSSQLLPGSTIISQQQIHIIPVKRQRGGKRRNFSNRRRIVKPNQITDIHAYIEKLKKLNGNQKQNVSTSFNIKTTTDIISTEQKPTETTPHGTLKGGAYTLKAPLFKPAVTQTTTAFTSTMQPQTTQQLFVTKSSSFVTSAGSESRQAFNVTPKDKPTTTTTVTTTTSSKIIRGKIPWKKLFGNQDHKELLKRILKPMKPATTTTKTPTMSAKVTMLLPTFGSIVQPSTKLPPSTDFKEQYEVSSEDSSGYSSNKEFEPVSEIRQTSNAQRYTEKVATTELSITSTNIPLLTTTETPVLQTLESPPFMKTDMRLKSSDSSSGHISGSGGSRRDFVYKRRGWQRPIAGSQKNGFRRKRPGKLSTTQLPTRTEIPKKQRLTSPLSKKMPIINTNKDKSKDTLFTGPKLAISLSTSTDTTRDETSTFSEIDIWKVITKPLTTELPSASKATPKPRSTTCQTTTKGITITPRSNSTTTRMNKNIPPPQKVTEFATINPQLKKVLGPDSTSVHENKNYMELPTSTKFHHHEERYKENKNIFIDILTTEQGYTDPTPYKNNDHMITDKVYYSTASSMIDFKASTQDVSFKPRIVGGNAASFTVLSNSDAFLPCEALGNPEPNISWKRFSSSTGNMLTIKGKMGKFEVFENGTLFIQDVNMKDRGQYLCLAENRHGLDKLLVTLSVVAYPSRILEPKVRDMKFQTGNVVEITCKAEGRPTPVISWILANRTQVRGYDSNRGRVTVKADGTLIIQQVSIYDRGHYKCIASNPAGADTATVRLQVVAVPPEIMEEKQQHIRTEPGRSLQLPCSTRGSPQPTVHWMLPDGTVIYPLQNSLSRVVLYTNGTLHLTDLVVTQSGQYECIAKSSTGSEQRVVMLSVQQADILPRITEVSQKWTELSYGSRLWLNCTATGEPKPRIVWRLPSKAVVDQWHRMGSRIHVLDNGTLIINSLSEKDSGDYFCVAQNKIGDDLQRMTVSVSMKPAKIETKLKDKKRVPYGNDLTVDCLASGAPMPEISWGLPDGTLLNSAMQSDDSGSRTRRYILFDNGTLYLNKVDVTEEGDYTCYAENTLGKDEMHVHITVVTASPRISTQSQTYTRVKPGENVRFDCEAMGEPKPRILWKLPSNDMIAASNSRYLMHVNGSLEIQDVELQDIGEFVCIARNTAGDERKVYRLEIDGNPPIINGYHRNRTVVRDYAPKYSKKFIDCKAEGNPQPTITWIMPDNIFIKAPYYGSRVNVHQNGTLEIRHVRLSDTAEFICMAQNNGGEAVMVVQLEVTSMLKRPIFRNPFNEKIMTQTGKTTILNCSADGYPVPDITWMLPNGTRLTGKNYGTFIIYNPSKADAGKYRCSAKNTVGYIEKLLILEVGEKPFILTRPKGIIRSMFGDPLFLHCLADGNPRPQIIWSVPSGLVLSRPQVSGRYLLLENGTLVIRETYLHDRGNYLCRAKSEFGEAVVTVPVMIVGYPPRITNGPLPNIHIVAGTPIQVHCMAMGMPKPEVSWELPDRSVLSSTGKVHSSGNEMLHPQGTLIIQKPQRSQSGTYKCIAKNSLGIDSKVANIYVL